MLSLLSFQDTPVQDVMRLATADYTIGADARKNPVYAGAQKWLVVNDCNGNNIYGKRLLHTGRGRIS